MADPVGAVGRRRGTSSSTSPDLGAAPTSSGTGGTGGTSGAGSASAASTSSETAGKAGAGVPSASSSTQAPASSSTGGLVAGSTGTSGAAPAAAPGAAADGAAPTVATGAAATPSGLLGGAAIGQDSYQPTGTGASSLGSLAGSGGSVDVSSAHLEGSYPSAAADVASLTSLSELGAQTVSMTVNVTSLGNTDAMTRELLASLAQSADTATTSLGLGDDLANQTALVGLAQKAVDNIPHLLVDTSEARGTRLYEPSQEQAGPQGRKAELTYLASDQQRVQAAAFSAAPPDWPLMMFDGLSRASSAWQGQLGLVGLADALARATSALYGREATVLTAKAAPAELFHTASLANAPLNLPAIGVLTDEQHSLQAFVVLSTQLAADGSKTVTLLDVSASLEQGKQVERTLQVDKFVQAMTALVVPTGRPALSGERAEGDALHSLGLIGCCLTSGGSSSRPGAGSLRASAPRGGRGLLENRCLTCPRAQSLCQPGA